MEHRRVVIEQGLAAIALALCTLLLARMFVAPRHRKRFDAALSRAIRALRRRAIALHARVRAGWRWRAAQREAARVAEEAIRRARDKAGNSTRHDDDDDEDGEWDGNVYKPKSFRRPRKPH